MIYAKVPGMGEHVPLPTSSLYKQREANNSILAPMLDTRLDTQLNVH